MVKLLFEIFFVRTFAKKISSSSFGGCVWYKVLKISLGLLENLVF